MIYPSEADVIIHCNENEKLLLYLDKLNVKSLNIYELKCSLVVELRSCIKRKDGLSKPFSTDEKSMSLSSIQNVLNKTQNSIKGYRC